MVMKVAVVDESKDLYLSLMTLRAISGSPDYRQEMPKIRNLLPRVTPLTLITRYLLLYPCR